MRIILIYDFAQTQRSPLKLLCHRKSACDICFYSKVFWERKNRGKVEMSNYNKKINTFFSKWFDMWFGRGSNDIILYTYAYHLIIDMMKWQQIGKSDDQQFPTKLHSDTTRMVCGMLLFILNAYLLWFSIFCRLLW